MTRSANMTPYRIQAYGDKGQWRVVTGRGRAYHIVAYFMDRGAAQAKADELNKIFADGMAA